MSGTRYPIRQEGNLTFSFLSEGPKGRIEKLVKYDQMDEETFNLGFGDRIGGTMNFDDKVVTDNGDTRRVLATVVATLEEFFKTYPSMYVYMEGSDEKRTRTYCWIVKNNRRQFENQFNFWGGFGNEYEPFESDRNYQFILISKK